MVGTTVPAMLPAPTFREALRFWAKLGCVSFGGPAGQIALLHTELVEKRRWIAEERFQHALNFCLLLPGPEATQLATYCGWALHGTRGGLAAGVLFILPSALLLWGLSWFYVLQGQLPVVAAIFSGLKPAVAGIVLAALIRIARRSLRRPFHWLLAAAGFGSLFLLRAPFPLVVAGAAFAGWLGCRWLDPEAGQTQEPGAAAAPWSWSRSLRVLAVSLILWWAPVLLAWVWQGAEGILVQQGLFFSQAAVVTFGGAYAVLPHVARSAVEVHGWLSGPQMLDGLGLAETTPGPLIMVLQFVGFLGGWQSSPEHPLLMGTLAAAMTTWTTFVPCFLWIFLGAPAVERGRRHPALRGALAGVSAVVVGVVLDLFVWFAAEVFRSGSGGVNGFAVGIALAAFAALQVRRIGVVPVILGSGLLGGISTLVR